MIEIKALEKYNQKRYTCQRCGIEVVFYIYVSKRRCYSCHAEMPDFEQMTANPHYRVKHFLGTAERNLPDFSAKKEVIHV